MTPLTSGGVSVGLPTGWEGEIFNRAPELGGRSLGGPAADTEVARNVIHLANFALPAERGDFGSCLLYTSPSPRDKRQSRMPSSA